MCSSKLVNVTSFTSSYAFLYFAIIPYRLNLKIQNEKQQQQQKLCDLVSTFDFQLECRTITTKRHGIDSFSPFRYNKQNAKCDVS